MGKEKNTSEKLYKFETLAIAVCVAVAFGFTAGAAFTIYKLDTSESVSRMPPASTGVSAAMDPGNESRIAMFEKVVKENPQDSATWKTLGDLYFDTKRYEEAINAYEKFLAILPNDPNVLTDLGVMHRRSGNSKKALESFERAITADPKHETARFNKGIVLLHDFNDEKSAVAAWRGLLEINPLAMAPNGQTVDELIKHFESQEKK